MTAIQPSAPGPVKITLSINETITATGLRRSKLYGEINSGRLRAVRAGRRTLVPVAAIEEWVRALPGVA